MVNSNQRAVVFSEEDIEFQKQHEEINVNGMTRELWKKFREDNYPESIKRILVEEKEKSALLQSYNFKINESSPTSESWKPNSPFHNKLKEAYHKGLLFSDVRAVQEQKITPEMEELFYPNDQRISWNHRGDVFLLDKWGNQLKFILDITSELVLQGKADYKKRIDEAIGKRDRKYWSDVKRINDRRKFLDDFANKHLDEQYAKEQKIQEEADVKLQIILKDFKRVDSRGLKILELIQKSKDKQRRIKLEKELEKLKNTRGELVQKILDADSNYTFKKFTWPKENNIKWAEE